MSKTEPTQFATRANTDRLFDLLKSISEGIGMSVDSIRTTAMTQNKYNNSAHDAQDQQLRDIKEILNAVVERIDGLDKSVEIQEQQLMAVGRAFDSMENKIHEWYRTAGRRHDEIMGQLHDMAEGRPEPQVENQPTQALSDSELRDPTAHSMANITHLYEELMQDNKRIRYDIQLHVERFDGIVRNLTGRISKLDIARETQNDELALLKGRIKALESNHEPQNDILSERSGETATPETPINVPPGYRIERVAYNRRDSFEVVQRWVDSTPEFFRHDAGEAVAIPTELKSVSGFSTLELILVSAAERLRRRRVEALKSQLGAFGPESHDYPRLKTQGANARTGSNEGQG